MDNCAALRPSRGTNANSTNRGTQVNAVTAKLSLALRNALSRTAIRSAVAQDLRQREDDGNPAARESRSTS